MAGPLDGFVTWILLLGNWVQIVLLGCAGYFVYLIAFNPMGEKKSGKEYGLGKGTGKKLWDKGKDAYKKSSDKAEKSRKKKLRRTHTRTLREHIEEEKELEKIDAIEIEMDRAVGAIDSALGRTKFNNVGQRDVLVNAVEAVEQKIKDSISHFRAVRRYTFRQETEMERLLGVLDDNEVDKQPIMALEKDILRKHKETKDLLRDQVLSKYTTVIKSSLRHIKLINFTGGSAVNYTRNLGGTTLQSRLTTIKNNLNISTGNSMRAELKSARDKQEAAVTDLQGIMVKTRELMG